MAGQAFNASNDRIWVTNAAGEIIFDTDRKMPAIIDVVEGQLTLPQRGPGANQTVVHHFVKGPLDIDPEFVFATGVITGGSTYPWRETTFNASGSIITNLAWHKPDDVTWYLGACRTITFIVLNKTLYVAEEYYNRMETFLLQAFTLKYKVYLGAFA